MNRKLETTDVIVAVGMIATLFGGYFLYVASFGGVLGVQPSMAKAVPLTTTKVERQLMDSIQQSIRQQEILNEKFKNKIAQAADSLQKAMTAAGQVTTNSLETTVARARTYKEDYEGNVQYMLGKTIINLTRQGMQSGALTAGNLDNRHNDRIIATAKRKRDRAEQAFQMHAQPRIANWIIAAAQKDQRRDGAIQERLGHASVELAKAKFDLNTQLATEQNQYRALVAAAIRTDAQDQRFTRLAQANNITPLSSKVSSQVVEAGILPELNSEVLVIAFLLLITILMLGLSFPTQERPSDRKNTPTQPVLHLHKRPTRKAS